MKLIVTGATGFVAKEVVRVAAEMAEITTVVAVSRRPVTLTGPGADKVRNVIIQNYDTYPESAKAEFAGAGACIWTVAVLPQKALSMDAEEVRRVCTDYTLAGLNAMCDAGPATPFRFLYVSGTLAAREPAEKPLLFGKYALMRGTVEKEVLALAKARGVEAGVARPGFMSTGTTMGNAAGWVLSTLGVAPSLTLTGVARAMVRQAVGGFEKEPLTVDDLARLGRE